MKITSWQFFYLVAVGTPGEGEMAWLAAPIPEY